MLFTIKTLHKFCVFRYLELKRNTHLLCLSLFRIETLFYPTFNTYLLNLKIITNAGNSPYTEYIINP